MVRLILHNPVPSLRSFIGCVEDKVINFLLILLKLSQSKRLMLIFATAYTVEGSESSRKIKELSLKQARLQSDVNALLMAVRTDKWGTMFLKTVWRYLIKIIRLTM